MEDEEVKPILEELKKRGVELDLTDVFEVIDYGDHWYLQIDGGIEVKKGRPRKEE
jgi:hypothetical protein